MEYRWDGGGPDAYFADFDAMGNTGRLSVARPQRDSIFTRPPARRLSLMPGVLAAAESQVRTRLGAGGRWIRTCMGLFLSSTCMGLFLSSTRFLVFAGSVFGAGTRSSSRRLRSGARSARKGSRDRNGSSLAACRLATLVFRSALAPKHAAR